MTAGVSSAMSLVWVAWGSVAVGPAAKVELTGAAARVRAALLGLSEHGPFGMVAFLPVKSFLMCCWVEGFVVSAEVTVSAVDSRGVSGRLSVILGGPTGSAGFL